MIDELARDTTVLIPFLESTTVQGVKIALSEAGGEAGTRQLPLLRNEACWDAIETRCRTLVRGAGFHQARDVIHVIRAAVASDAVAGNLRRKLLDLLDKMALALLASHVQLPKVSGLELYLDIWHLRGGSLPLPELEPWWDLVSFRLETSLRTGFIEDPSEVSGWCSVIRIVQDTGEESFATSAHRERMAVQRERLLELAQNEDSDLSGEDADVYESEAERLAELARVLRGAGIWQGAERELIGRITKELDREADRCREKAIERQDEESSWESAWDERERGQEEVNVDRIFEDL